MRCAELKPGFPASVFPSRSEKRQGTEAREKPNISRPRSNDIPRIQELPRRGVGVDVDVDVFDDDFESVDFLAAGELVLPN